MQQWSRADKSPLGLQVRQDKRAGRGPAGVPVSLWLITATVAGAELMLVMDSTVLVIALPTIQDDLGFSYGFGRWLSIGYTLSTACFLLAAGRVVDAYGPRPVFTAGLALFAAASMIAGSAIAPVMLLVGRVLQGSSGAFVATAGLAVLAKAFDGSPLRAKAFGIYSLSLALGAACGLLVGGVGSQVLGWRWLLYSNLLAALLVLIGARRSFPPTAPPDLSLLYDKRSIVYVACALGLLTYGLSELGSAHASLSSLMLYLLGGLTAMLMFTRRQMTAECPLIPVRIVRDRDRVASLISVFMSNAGSAATFLAISYYLQRHLHVSPTRSSLALFFLVVVIGASSIFTSAVLIVRTSPKMLMSAGALLAAVGMYWSSHISSDSTYWRDIALPLAFCAVGLSAINAVASGSATNGVGLREAGAAAAVAHSVYNLGSSSGIVVLAILANLREPASGPSEPGGFAAGLDISGMSRMFQFFALGLTVTAIVVWVLHRPERPSTVAE